MGGDEDLTSPLGDCVATSFLARVRHPGENRGPEKPLKSTRLDTGFRRYDDQKQLNLRYDTVSRGRGIICMKID